MTYLKNKRFMYILFVIVPVFFVQNNQTATNAQENELVNELTIPVDCETLTEALAKIAENGTVFLEERTKLVVTSPIEISKNVSVIGKGLLKSTVVFKDAGSIRIKIDDPGAARIKPAEVSSNDAVKFPETVFNAETNVVFRNINFEREGRLNETIDNEYEGLVQERNVALEHGLEPSISEEQFRNEGLNYRNKMLNFQAPITIDAMVMLIEKKDYLLLIESGNVSVKDCTVSNCNGVGIAVFGSNSNLIAENSIFGNNYAGGIIVKDSKIFARYCIFSKSLDAAIYSENSKALLYFCSIKDSGLSGVSADDDSVVGLVETEVSNSIAVGIACSNGTTLYMCGGKINNTLTSIEAHFYCNVFVEEIQLSNALVNVNLTNHSNFQAKRSHFSNSGFLLDCQHHCVVTFEKTVKIYKSVPRDGALGSGSLFHRSDEIDSPPVLTLLEEALSL